MNLSPSLFSLLILVFFSCTEKQGTESDTHPSIFLVRNKTEGFSSVVGLKNIKIGSHQEVLWQDLLSKSIKDFDVPYLDPTVDFEGRSPVHLKHANVSYDMERGLTERLSRSSLLFAITKEAKYKDLVMRQVYALKDTTLWPMWCDQA
ncbi:MAG: hypothetical protein ACI9GZ_002533, partial [Bacteroidia bacterium]